MGPAYLYQSVNLVVGVLMVPLLLRYLDAREFVLWAVFTTWGALTLQIENSIQTVSVRRIASAFHAGATADFVASIARARRAYRALALLTLLGVALGGGLYLAVAVQADAGTPWVLAWCVFILAYALNYWFGANNAILLATARVGAFSYIAALSRSLNFCLTFAALWAGKGVLGICASFAASVVLNCTLIAIQARRALPSLSAGLPPTPSRDSGKHVAADVVRYMMFTVAAFALYKGGLLVAASRFSDLEVSAYSLALQAFTMLSSLALVPIQAWLARLVAAIMQGGTALVVRELSRTLVVANVVFAAGTLALAWVGDDLLGVISAQVMLPPRAQLLTIAAAFVIELNLLILINLLVTQQRFGFVKIYLGSVLAAMVAAAGALALGQPMVLSLVLLPLLFQLSICVPLIFGLVARQLGMTPVAFLRSLLRGRSPT